MAAWTDAQNAYTREVLDGLPGRAALDAPNGRVVAVDLNHPERARGLLVVEILRDASSRTEAFLGFSSFNTPQSLYRVDLATGESELSGRRADSSSRSTSRCSSTFRPPGSAPGTRWTS